MCFICGVVSTRRDEKIVKLVHRMAGTMQHRGYAQAGGAWSDRKIVRIYKDNGFFQNVFDLAHSKDVENDMPVIFIGHGRYPTTGSSIPKNAHPFYLDLPTGRIALITNGDTNGVDELKRKMIREKQTAFEFQSDAEFILKYIVEAADRKQRNLVAGITAFMKEVPAAYSAALMIRDKLFLFRDPRSIRPLCYGWHGKRFVFASETCALEKIGAEGIEYVKPGTIMEVGLSGHIETHEVFTRSHCDKNCARCVFEGIYFSRPDSRLFDGNVCGVQFRMECGKLLLEQLTAKGILDEILAIIPILDSGVFGCQGLSLESKIMLVMAILKNPNVFRTFIFPGQINRQHLALEKHQPLKYLLSLFPDIFIGDDSIVRATTTKGLVRSLRRNGAKKIHMGVFSPPLVGICNNGIDIPTLSELIAHNKTVSEIQRFIGLDSLTYLSMENLKRALKICGYDPSKFCMGCLTGEYPF